jgi:hypothetical protein
MEKKFKLPKDFAIKWLEALRSGTYKQSEGQLVGSPDNTLTLENTSFCCLGVAGYICGYQLSQLYGYGFLIDELFPNVPKEIQDRPDDQSLVHVLSSLNDGIAIDDKVHFENLGYIFRPLEESDLIQYNFTQIADFIEDNVEFYEIEETVEAETEK